MIANLSSIKFFFSLLCLIPSNLVSLDYPEPKAKPEIKLLKFDDVFKQIKNRTGHGTAVADDYNNKSYHLILGGWISRDLEAIMTFYLTNFLKLISTGQVLRKLLKKMNHQLLKILSLIAC